MQGVDGARGPQPQRVDVPPPPADDRRVVSHRPDGFAGVPAGLRASLCRTGPFDPAAELDVVAHFGALEFPRIAKGQPLLGVLLLPPVLDYLLKEAVVVTDPIAAGGDPEARQAFEKARCEAPETAIAECRVGFGA